MPLTDEQLAAGITDEELAQDEIALQQRIAALTGNLHAANGALAQVRALRERLAKRAEEAVVPTKPIRRGAKQTEGRTP